MGISVDCYPLINFVTSFAVCTWLFLSQLQPMHVNTDNLVIGTPPTVLPVFVLKLCWYFANV